MQRWTCGLTNGSGRSSNVLRMKCISTSANPPGVPDSASRTCRSAFKRASSSRYGSTPLPEPIDSISFSRSIRGSKLGARRIATVGRAKPGIPRSTFGEAPTSIISAPRRLTRSGACANPCRARRYHLKATHPGIHASPGGSGSRYSARSCSARNPNSTEPAKAAAMNRPTP